MKMGDGLFIKCASENAKKYPDIEYWEEQIARRVTIRVSIFIFRPVT